VISPVPKSKSMITAPKEWTAVTIDTARILTNLKFMARVSCVALIFTV